jgi:2-polyprenyl-3-methyl-5-hydroxy-6-metoxy-1,4-benzoquinol methylase
MSIQLDAQGHETGALFDLVDLEAKDVLEIGCGDGRLTWRYIDRTAHVTAIDPFAESIDRANRSMPDAAAGKLNLGAVAFEDFAAETAPSTFGGWGSGITSCR